MDRTQHFNIKLSVRHHQVMKEISEGVLLSEPLTEF